MRAYCGAEPYCFVSYAHVDIKRVLPFAEEMHHRGLRIWFDEGIDPGTEWAESIAQRLADSSYFIVFMSANSLASQNVRREIHFAISLQKKMLCLYLEEFSMSAGMHLQLDANQAVYLNKYPSPAMAVDRFFLVFPESMVAPSNPEQEIAMLPRQEEKLTKASRTDTSPLKDLHSIRCLIPVTAIALAVAVLGLLYSGTATGAIQIPSSQNAYSTATAEDPNTTQVTLSADANLNYTEVDKATKLLQERLTNWFGKDGYSMTSNNGQVSLALPTDGFAPLSVEEGLLQYFIRPTDLYICDAGSSGDAFDLETNSVSIPRDSIESIDVIGGFPDYANPSDYDIDAGEITSLSITLKKNAWKTFESAIATWDDRFVIALDLGYNPVYGFNNIAIEKSLHQIAILPDSESVTGDPAGNLCPALAFDLLHEPLPGSFNATVHKHIDWHAFDAQDRSNNEVSIGELSKGTTTTLIDYSSYDDSEPTEGEYTDLIRVIGSRLDAMEVPYAFGIDIDDKHTLAVCLPTSYAGYPVADMIAFQSSSLVARYGMNQYMILETSLHETVSECSLICTLDDKDKKELVSSLKGADNSDAIYLYIGSYPVFVAYPTDVDADGTIEFKQTCFAGDELWLFRLANAMINGQEMPSNLFLLTSIYVSGDSSDSNIVEFGINYDRQVTQVLNIAKQTCPNATAYAENSDIYVSLHMDVDETLPKTSLEAIEKIYKDLDFQHSVFDSIIFTPCSVRLGERASLLFTSTGSILNTDPKEYFVWFFRGGRLERYKKEFADLIDKSDFYRQLVSEY